MILSHSKKFIFFRVPKTGSTTADVMLRLANVWDYSQDVLTATKEWELPGINSLYKAGYGPRDTDDPDYIRVNWAHVTPQQLIDYGVMTLEQLREYDCYAFLRPVEGRFVSGYLHCMRGGKWGKYGRYGYQAPQFIEKWRNEEPQFSAGEIIGRPQKDYFFVGDEQIVKPLDFANYKAELDKLFEMLGGNTFSELPRINRAAQSGQLDNPRRREWAKEIWADYPEVQEAVLERYAEDHAFYVENFGEPYSN